MYAPPVLAAFSLTFDSVALAVHIVSAFVAFGVIFAYPLFAGIGNSILDPGGLPLFHRAQVQIIRRLVNPGLVLVVASGLVLAADTRTLARFYSEWGILAAIVLGGIAGAYLAPREARLAELAARDLADGGVLSEDYDALSYRVGRVNLVASVIVLATIVVMVAHT
jgi:hypothetical protein